MQLRAWRSASFFLLFLFLTPTLMGFSPAVPNQKLTQIFDDLESAGNISAFLRPLWDGDQAWYSRWKLVEGAKSTIDCNFFQVDRDIFGMAFLGLLAKKARDGVTVRLMIDARSYQTESQGVTPGLLKGIADSANLLIKIYNPVFKSSLIALEEANSIFGKNKTNLIIIDGSSCILGERKIGKGYFVITPESPARKIFFDLLIQGKSVVRPLKSAFEEEWKSLKNLFLERQQVGLAESAARLDMAYRVMSRFIFGLRVFDVGKKEIPEELRKELRAMNFEISEIKNFSSYDSFQLLQSDHKKSIKMADSTKVLIKLIEGAKEEIFIQSPYMIWSDTGYAALKKACSRGVRIVFHFAGKKTYLEDVPCPLIKYDWKQILKDLPSCRIIVRPMPKKGSKNEKILDIDPSCYNEYFHSGIFVFDSQIAVFEAYTKDLMSEASLSEKLAVIHNRQISTEIRSRLDKEMENSFEYKIKFARKGKPAQVGVPDDHFVEVVSKKMKFLQELGFLPPVF